jgi:hypothetical protein
MEGKKKKIEKLNPQGKKKYKSQKIHNLNIKDYQNVKENDSNPNINFQKIIPFNFGNYEDVITQNVNSDLVQETFNEEIIGESDQSNGSSEESINVTATQDCESETRSFNFYDDSEDNNEQRLVTNTEEQYECRNPHVDNNYSDLNIESEVCQQNFKKETPDKIKNFTKNQFNIRNILEFNDKMTYFENYELPKITNEKEIDFEDECCNVDSLLKSANNRTREPSKNNNLVNDSDFERNYINLKLTFWNLIKHKDKFESNGKDNQKEIVEWCRADDPKQEFVNLSMYFRVSEFIDKLWYTYQEKAFLYDSDFIKIGVLLVIIKIGLIVKASEELSFSLMLENVVNIVHSFTYYVERRPDENGEEFDYDSYIGTFLLENTFEEFNKNQIRLKNLELKNHMDILRRETELTISKDLLRLIYQDVISKMNGNFFFASYADKSLQFMDQIFNPKRLINFCNLFYSFKDLDKSSYFKREDYIQPVKQLDDFGQFNEHERTYASDFRYTHTEMLQKIWFSQHTILGLDEIGQINTFRKSLEGFDMSKIIVLKTIMLFFYKFSDNFHEKKMDGEDLLKWVIQPAFERLQKAPVSFFNEMIDNNINNNEIPAIVWDRIKRKRVKEKSKIDIKSIWGRHLEDDDFRNYSNYFHELKRAKQCEEHNGTMENIQEPDPSPPKKNKKNKHNLKVKVEKWKPKPSEKKDIDISQIPNFDFLSEIKYSSKIEKKIKNNEEAELIRSFLKDLLEGCFDDEDSTFSFEKNDNAAMYSSGVNQDADTESEVLNHNLTKELLFNFKFRNTITIQTFNHFFI